MSIIITPTASGPYWQDAAGNEYVRLDVMRQQMKTQDTIARMDRDRAQALLSQARIDASWEKQRGDRYRARALALVKQAKRWRAVIANERGIRAMQQDITRGHMDRAEKAERERATADRLRLEALQEVERLKAQVASMLSLANAEADVQAGLRARVAELERRTHLTPDCAHCSFHDGQHTEHCPFAVPRL
jgi:hypothetical protein